jgi:hypothetical protein
MVDIAPTSSFTVIATGQIEAAQVLQRQLNSRKMR